MSLRINHNLASMNGHRNMVKNDMALSRSLEKLSSGLKINRAADDAAGLIISEQMRAQISGLNQAVDNTETAVAMVQTAEGALDEMNTLLNKARELAVHAANAGANDSNQLLADQTELDNILTSITRIAENTQFGTKKILDGSLSNAQVLNKSAVSQFSQTGLTTGNIAVNVTTAGVKAGAAAASTTAVSDTEAAALTNSTTGAGVTAASTFDNQTTISILNRDQTTRASVTVAAGTSVGDALALLNKQNSGVTTAVNSTGQFSLAADDYGTYANGSRLVIQGGSTTANVGYNAGTGVVSGVMTGGVNVQVNRGTDGTAAAVANSALSSQTGIFETDTNGAAENATAAVAASTFAADTTLSLVDASGNVIASVLAAADTNAAAATAGDTTFAEALTALSTAASGKFTVAVGGAAGQVNITAAAGSGVSANGVYLKITSGSNTTTSGATTGGVDNTSSGFGAVALTADGDRGTTFSGKNSTGTQTVNLSLATGVGGAVSSNANALKVADGAVFQIGANKNQTVAVSLSSAKASDLGLGVVAGKSLDSLRTDSFLTAGRAQEALSIIDDAIDEVTVLRGRLGAVQQNTLESNLSNLRATLENTTAAESIIRDVDFAAESSIFTKNNILVQASTAMLAQANQLPQNVLKLLG